VKTYSKQYRHLATIITGVGLTFFSITAKAETIGYEQSPGHFGGFFANLADEFQLDQSALIRNITWWGGYYNTYGDFPPPVADNVIIRLFADHSGKPGVLLGAFHVGNDVNRVATGDFENPPELPDFPDPFPGRPEFKYSFDLPEPILAKANTRYWLSIIDMPVSDEFAWEVSDSPINPGFQVTSVDPVFGPWEREAGDNTAFQVGIDPVVVSDSPEPSSVILLATVVGLTMFVGRRRMARRWIS
jgi:hypothetical protein